MKTSAHLFKERDFVDMRITGVIENFNPHSEFPYEVTFLPPEGSEKFEAWKIRTSRHCLKPFNLASCRGRVRYMVFYSVILGILFTGCVLFAFRGSWYSFLSCVAVFLVLSLSIAADLSYFKKYHEEDY